MSKTCSICSSEATDSCTFCRAAICNEHTKLGQPFITARQLVTTTASTAVRAPQLLGDILFKELDEVAYCPSCRQEIAAKRQSEQMKFLLVVLLLMLLVASIPIYFLLVA